MTGEGADVGINTGCLGSVETHRFTGVGLEQFGVMEDLVALGNKSPFVAMEE